MAAADCTRSFWSGNVADTGGSRAVWWCATCGGHVGVSGSLAERCADEHHARELDHWSTSEETSWRAHYGRELQRRQAAQARDDERRSAPLIQRLRASGLSPSRDGGLSIRVPEIDDAHEAADALEELLSIAERLMSADPDERYDAACALVELRAHIGDYTGGKPERFEEAAGWLFSRVNASLAARAVDPAQDCTQLRRDEVEIFAELPVVCVEHKRFIPCRTCMYQQPAGTPYSNDPADVAEVRDHHSR